MRRWIEQPARPGEDGRQIFTQWQALSLLEQAETPIALVLTDIAMPEMSGAELVNGLKERFPRIRILPYVWIRGRCDLAAWLGAS